MGFFDKIKQGLEKTRRQMGGLFAEFTGENEEFFEELEDSLILADAGADTAMKAVEELRERVRANALRGADEVKGALVDILAEHLSVGRTPSAPPPPSSSPSGQSARTAR